MQGKEGEVIVHKADPAGFSRLLAGRETLATSLVRVRSADVLLFPLLSCTYYSFDWRHSFSIVTEQSSPQGADCSA